MDKPCRTAILVWMAAAVWFLAVVLICCMFLPVEATQGPELEPGPLHTPEPAPATEPMEDPDEAALIETALLARGYFREDVPLSFELQDHLHTACERYGVPYHVALGLIEVESGFDPDAVNPASGCYGLCQLHPDYFPSGLSPAENIETGMGYLGTLLERYGELGAALTAYHAGHDTGGRTYANAVMDAAERWQ